MPARALSTLFLIFVLMIAGTPAGADWQSGLAAFQAGDLDAAAREFQSLAESQPDWYGGHLMLGQTLLRQKKPSAAIPHLRRAHELSKDAATSMALAQAAAYVKQWPLVRRALEGVDPSALDAKQQASFYRLSGLAAVGGKDWATAVLQLERAAQITPDDAGLRSQLAAAARKANRLELAISHYEAARRLEPRDFETLGALTSVRYTRAMTLDGEPKAAACREAAAEGNELLRSPKTPNEMRLMVGLLQACGGEKDTAIETFAKTAERDPGEWQPLYYLARTHADSQQWDEAETMLQKLGRHRLDPAATEKVTRLRGRVYEGQHRFELAIEQYEDVGDADRVARARRSLGIQERNEELERIQEQIDAIEKASSELDEQEEELGGGRGPLR